MKPASFDYFAPRSLSDAVSMLGAAGPDAKLLAGGQTLVPAMSMRLARPSALIDLNGVTELAFLRETAEGLEIGAMTRQRALEDSEIVGRRASLFHRALPHVAHFQIRNRGTIGGSLVHNDPAAELPAVVTALDGVLELVGPKGRRRLNADDFFQGMLTTALDPDEILATVHIPALPDGVGTGFAEIARRHGDFALAGALAILHQMSDGAIDLARLVLFGVGTGPVRARAAEALLCGEIGGPKLWDAAATRAVRDLEPSADQHASAIYRREAAKVLARRVLAQAWEGTHGRAH